MTLSHDSNKTEPFPTCPNCGAWQGSVSRLESELAQVRVELADLNTVRAHAVDVCKKLNSELAWVRDERDAYKSLAKDTAELGEEIEGLKVESDAHKEQAETLERELTAYREALWDRSFAESVATKFCNHHKADCIVCERRLSGIGDFTAAVRARVKGVCGE